MSTPKRPKHPEDEDEKDLEPLADPEPEDAPPIHEPDEDEPDEKAAATPTIREDRGDLIVAVIGDRMERRLGQNTYEISGPHHS